MKFYKTIRVLSIRVTIHPCNDINHSNKGIFVLNLASVVRLTRLNILNRYLAFPAYASPLRSNVIWCWKWIKSFYPVSKYFERAPWINVFLFLGIFMDLPENVRVPISRPWSAEFYLCVVIPRPQSCYWNWFLVSSTKFSRLRNMKVKRLTSVRYIAMRKV